MSAAVQYDFEDTRLRPNKLKNWTPKKWRVEYERIVALSVIGNSNKMIAQMTGYTPVHVSNILNLPEAEELRQIVLKKMRENAVNKSIDITSKMEEAAQLASKRLIEMLKDDGLFEKSPFAVIDRGMDVLKGLHHLKGTNQPAPGGTNIEKAVIIGGPTAAGLLEGMSKADKAIEINGDVK